MEVTRGWPNGEEAYGKISLEPRIVLTTGTGDEGKTRVEKLGVGCPGEDIRVVEDPTGGSGGRVGVEK